MTELDEATRQGLQARDGPPPGAGDQILAALRVRLAGHGGPGDPSSSTGEAGEPDASPDTAGSGPELTSAGRGLWAAKVAAATTSLAGAGLLTLKLGVVGLAALRADAPPQNTTQETAALGSSVEVNTDEPGAASPQTPGREPSSPTVAIPADRLPQTRSAQPPSGVPEDSGDSDLAAEVALLRAARRERLHDPEAAFTQLERHRRRFPSGTLAPERDALAVEVLCALGRPADAQQARRRLETNHPDSAWLPILGSTCTEGDGSSRRR